MSNKAEWPPVIAQKLAKPSMALRTEESLELISACVSLGETQALRAAGAAVLMVIGNTGEKKNQALLSTLPQLFIRL